MDYALPHIDFGRDEVPDLDALVAGLQDAGERVVPVRYLGATAWLILRHEDVGRAFRDSTHFPASAAHLRYSLPVQGKTLLCMEGRGASHPPCAGGGGLPAQGGAGARRFAAAPARQ